MEFGKLPSIEKVDFSLPPEPAENAGLLATFPAANAKAIYIGPTGYHMKNWAGKWYPAGARTEDHLKYYGKQFNTIEHNTTHYRIPDEATVRRWYEQTPSDFKFCPKIPQSISHAPDLGLNSAETQIFCAQISGLQEKLGCCFLQLAPGFGPRNLIILQRFLEKFPREIPLAVEVRHPQFFKPGAEQEQLFKLLSDQQVTAVITDVAGRRDVCHLRLTTGTTMIRFVGNGLHPTDYTRVQAWARQLKRWFEAGLETAYFFSHEPDNLLAPELAEYSAEIFSAQMPEVQLRGPKLVGGRQGTLF